MFDMKIHPYTLELPMRNRMLFLMLAAMICIPLYSGCKKQKPPAPKKVEKPSPCPADMLLVPAGGLMIGCSGTVACNDDEKPARNVTLLAFCVDRAEVSQDAYKKETGKNPSRHTECGGACPVDNVAWADADAFCKKTGKRLPTEAEWEKAARAGAKTRFPWGDAFAAGNAWLADNSGGKPHPAAKAKPNALGINDMIGNVAEWTRDCYDVTWYARMSEKNPSNDTPGCTLHTVRGGSWSSKSENENTASRSGYSVTAEFIGFRCAADVKDDKNKKNDKKKAYEHDQK